MHKPFEMMESTDRNAEYEEDDGILLKSSLENASAFLQGSGHEINEFLESAEAD